MNILKSTSELKKDFFKKENIYFFLIILIGFLLDRTSKIEIIKNFSTQSHYINDYINLDLTWNIGIGFGFLSTDSTLIYNLISLVIFIVIISLTIILIKSNTSEKIIYAIIIGGALGNFYDRIIFNAVPDFIDLHFKNFHWFTFNVADIFITMGILIYLIKEFIKN